MTLRLCSWGGGTQSMAIQVLMAQGRIERRTMLFCNVGDDSENPDTLTYLDEYARPHAEAHGLELIVLHKTRKGEPDTVRSRIARNPASPSIPLRGQNGMPAFKRACTKDFKIKLMGKWAKAHGATAENPASVAIGFSVDEFIRIAKSQTEAWERLCYPLIDLRLTRHDCQDVIRAAGLPIPPRSACWFCPYHTLSEWRTLKRLHPDLFEQACDLEDEMNAAALAKGKRPAWFTRYGRPLREVMADTGQLHLLPEDEGGCDTGYCWR